MSISLLSLSRHRITASFLTYNNNLLLHHHHVSSSSSSRFLLLLFKAKELFHTLSPDDQPSLLHNQAIGMVAANQTNFIRVIVESAGSPAEKPRRAVLEASSSKDQEKKEEPRVGVEVFCAVKTALKVIMKVLVGDKVLVGSIDWVGRRGMIQNVFERKSQVMNPPVANVDHLLVLFSLDQPKLEAFSVTRFLIEAESTDIPFTLALNKTELVDEETEREWRDRLRGWGYEALFCSVESKRGFDSIECLLKGQKTVIVGPSGVGKSSLINALRRKQQQQHVSDTEQGINSFKQIKGSKWLEKDQRVAEVSTKSGRGKNTTCHVTLLPISGGGYLADTPGLNLHSTVKATKKSGGGGYRDDTPADFDGDYLEFSQPADFDGEYLEFSHQPSMKKAKKMPSMEKATNKLFFYFWKVTKESLALMFPESRKMLSGTAKCESSDCLHDGEHGGCVVTADWERYPYYLQLLEEIKIRDTTIGTNRREGDIRYKIGDGVKQEPPKYRRPSRKSINQSLLDEFEEEQDDDGDRC